jgi:hypothetical protein
VDEGSEMTDFVTQPWTQETSRERKAEQALRYFWPFFARMRDAAACENLRTDKHEAAVVCERKQNRQEVVR